MTRQLLDELEARQKAAAGASASALGAESAGTGQGAALAPAPRPDPDNDEVREKFRIMKASVSNMYSTFSLFFGLQACCCSTPGLGLALLQAAALIWLLQELDARRGLDSTVALTASQHRNWHSLP